MHEFREERVTEDIKSAVSLGRRMAALGLHRSCPFEDINLQNAWCAGVYAYLDQFLPLEGFLPDRIPAKKKKQKSHAVWHRDGF